MKKNYVVAGWHYWGLTLLVISLIVSCHRDHTHFSKTGRVLVKDSMNKMMAKIATDVSQNGPRAWLNYFEDTQDFFMANDGQLVFHDYATAKPFILNTVVKAIPHIKLRWDNVRIDPLTSRLATIGADFQEDQINAGGQKLFFEGYFTATAHYTGHRWKLRNAHWSSKMSEKEKK